jgi:hypothetical protein
MKKLLVILLFLPRILFCQLSDTFDDGDFTNNPSWNGTTDNFIVNSNFQLQLNALTEGNAYLTSTYSSQESTEWRFYIKLSFSPSGNNFARVFLYSDVADPTAATSAYFLQFGEAGSEDAIELFKIESGSTTSICRGTGGLLSGSFGMDVKVLRTATGEWNIYADATATQNYNLEATGTDNTFLPVGYFGFYCQYTSSNASKMYFDNVYAGNLVVDVSAPRLTGLTVTDPFGLSLIFSEPTDAQYITDIMNYTVDGEIGHPETTIIGGSPAEVSLQFNNAFENGRTNLLTISNIRDLAGNIMTDTSVQFSYYEASSNEVVINEIMADPGPVVGLPEWEYIELFNTTGLRIDLSGWKVMIGESEKLIESAVIEPNAFLILTHEDALPDLSEFGETIGFSSFQLTNAGTNLKLLSNRQAVISNISYSDNWYNDFDKKEGGWSLEQIDPLNSCGGKNNWSASNAAPGGTPGSVNSVNATNNAPPKTERFSILTSNILQIWFDQQMDEISLANVAFYELSPGNINPSSTLLNETEPEFVQLVFDQEFEEGTIYTLKINSMVLNCSGLAVAEETEITFGIPNPVSEGDIIINEVLFNPLGDGVDYVEIYNKTNKIFDIEQLMLGSVSQTIPNPSDTTLKYVSETSRLMLPETYILLSASSATVLSQFNSQFPENFVEMPSFPTYSNEDGTVLLKSKSGKLIDAFTYSDGMHFPLLSYTDGVTLERISFSVPTTETTNWHSAAETVGFGTPGYQNSMFMQFDASTGEITIVPEIFSPDSDGKDDVTALEYRFDQAGFTFNAFVFDVNGIQIRHLVKSTLVESEGTFFWDGENENGNKVPVGIYVIAVEVFNLEGSVENYKKTVVVGLR